MNRQGFRVFPCDKWPGSIEDGIAHLNSYERILIHPRCKNFADEARKYSYKVDRMTGAVLPVIVDKFNHLIDAARYALGSEIKRRGTVMALPSGLIVR